ncbi:MAG: D-tyrosyl-tRNA(Tyr) deacylase, partial [Bacilli bacterium]|nr:D-tyrosyl-tRNA(Tyr) deacylase [Bacilli bacterium]
IINLRMFDDENGVMNRSLLDTKGSILSISQFTLYADTRKGRRPSYLNALRGEEATKLYDEFNKLLRDNNIKVETGQFGADMKVRFTNDGPVTIILDSEDYK